LELTDLETTVTSKNFEERYLIKAAAGLGRVSVADYVI
jgi:hypothetical protein